MCIVLVTGFNVYGGYQVNPSAEIAEALKGLQLACCRVESIVLPVSLKRAPRLLEEAVEKYKPSAIVSMGLAPRLHRVALELAAVSIAHFPDYPDEDSYRAELEPVDGGLEALTPTIPVEEVYEECARRRGLPLTVGVSAGTYLCNVVAYTAYKLARRHSIMAGFLHLPPTSELALRHGIPHSLPLWEQLETVRCILGVLAHKACSSTRQ